MILLVDVGNTKVKWRMLDDEMNIVQAGSVKSSEFTNNYASVEFYGISISFLYVSNVASNKVSIIFEKLAKQKKAEYREFKSQRHILKVRFGYKNVDEFGVDRALALVGAYSAKGVLVIDAGSAITADYLNDKGEHLGGYIVPGLWMTKGLLGSGTERVDACIGPGVKDLGITTSECVNNGSVILFHSLLDGLIIQAKKNGIEQFFVTGGDGKLFSEWSNGMLRYVENLVLDGLAKCYQENICNRG